MCFDGCKPNYTLEVGEKRITRRERNRKKKDFQKNGHRLIYESVKSKL